VNKDHAHDSAQLAFFPFSRTPATVLAADPPRRDSPPPKKTRATARRPAGATRGQHSPPPPAYRAPRGDLFREHAEKQWAAPDNKQQTTEDMRREVYERLARSVGETSYRRKRKLCGPIEKLRRQIGSNRYYEFAHWLQKIRDLRGASVPVRYRSLLTAIGRAIDGIAIEYRYTFDDFDTSTRSWQTTARDLLNHTRDLLNRASHDVAHLQPLLSAMARLHSDLGNAKRRAVLPPPPPPIPPTAEEMREWRETQARSTRTPRVAESRKWLREFANPEKQEETDLRAGGGWISVSNAIEMLRDDLRGYGDKKPLWTTIPSVDQLSEDYRIGKRDAGRVLTAYSKSTSESQ
jgi:hypothetical protein